MAKKKSENENEKSFFDTNVLTVVCGSILGVIGYLVFAYLSRNQYFSIKPGKLVREGSGPKYWGVSLMDTTPRGELKNVDKVFERLGFQFANVTNVGDWDILWSVNFPYKSKAEVFKTLWSKPLQYFQRINHIPGADVTTSKQNVRTNTAQYLPEFQLPDMAKDLKEFILANPSTKFLLRDGNHKALKVVGDREIHYDDIVLYETFVDNPLLIDGHSMTMGVFVLVSSVDPIRIHRFVEEVDLKFPSEPFHPFDVKESNRYEITGKYLNINDIPSLKSYQTRFGYSSKSSLEGYFASQGYNIEEIWKKIDDMIVQVFIDNAEHMVEETKKWFKESKHVFQIARLDFVFDQSMVPHLYGVDLTPSTSPKTTTESMNTAYEQLIYSTLKTVGASNKFDFFLYNDEDALKMVSHVENIATNPKSCYELKCHETCDPIECQECLTCINESDVNAMYYAYQEHNRRAGFERIYPSTDHYSDDFISLLSPSNQVSARWFRAKCAENSQWC